MGHDSWTFRLVGRLDSEEGRQAGGRNARRSSAGIAGSLKAALQPATRPGIGETHRLKAVESDDVVVLSFANGLALVLAPSQFVRLLESSSRLPSTSNGVRPVRGALAGTSREEPLDVPACLRWPLADQPDDSSHPGEESAQAIISTFEIVSAKGDVPSAVAAFESRQKHGLFRVNGSTDDPSARLEPAAKIGQGGRGLEAEAGSVRSKGAALVLIHEIACSFDICFAPIWDSHRSMASRLHDFYGERGVFAFEHPSLTQDPVANARALVECCEDGQALHLLGHGRGGIVAEVLARASALAAREPSAQPHADPGPTGDALRALVGLMRERQVRVDRVVRIASPVRGTLFAGQRPGVWFSVTRWLIAQAGRRHPGFDDMLPGLARFDGGADRIPGLQAMHPESALIQWLCNDADAASGDLRVIAGDVATNAQQRWVRTLVTDSLVWTDSDLLVQTRSCFGGAMRETPEGRGGIAAQFRILRDSEVSHFSYAAVAKSAAIIVDALVDDQPMAFEAIATLNRAPASRRAQDDDATGSLMQSARELENLRSRARAASNADRHACIFVPGLMASMLEHRDDPVWPPCASLSELQRLAWSRSDDADDREAVAVSRAVSARTVDENAPTPDATIDVDVDGVTADRLLPQVFDPLISRLAETEDLLAFPYDWRRPIESSAEALAGVLGAAMDARAVSGRAVRLVTHGTGALVLRALAIVAPRLWARLFDQHREARIVMIAPTHDGWWLPMQCLSGDESFGNLLSGIGALFDESKVRGILARMPGLIDSQAGLLDPALDLSRRRAWKDLADPDFKRSNGLSRWHEATLGHSPARWALPADDLLENAGMFQRRLAGTSGSLEARADQIHVVVGTARFTPGGIEIGADGQFGYRQIVDAGDGRVLHRSSTINGASAHQSPVDHMQMMAHRDTIDATVDLLLTGKSTRLPPLRIVGSAAGAREEATVRQVFRSRGGPGGQAGDPAADARALFRAPSEGIKPLRHPAQLEVEVRCNDLAFVAQPMLVGHYRSWKLAGSEQNLDRLIGGVMSRSLATHFYPDAPGSNQVFVNRKSPVHPSLEPRPRLVTVVGLGDEGRLEPQSLVYSVRQGVIATAMRIAELGDPESAAFELAATLIGSGGPRLTPGLSAQLVAQGVRDANLLLRAGKLPPVRRLLFIELYLDRAGEAWRALKLQADASPAAYRIVGRVEKGPGGLMQSNSGRYRGSDHDLVSVSMEPGRDADEAILQYTVDSHRARTERRAQGTQLRLLRELVRRGATNGGADPDHMPDPKIARTLFNLLVPFELGPCFGGNAAMVLELDDETARLPWELLDTSEGLGDRATEPWAIRTRMLRKLRTADFRGGVVDASMDAAALVIGDPLTIGSDSLLEEDSPQNASPQHASSQHASQTGRDDDRSSTFDRSDRQSGYGRIPSLPAARAEAEDVSSTLADRKAFERDGIHLRIGSPAHDIINELQARDYRIVHVSGHGVPGRHAGVVLSGGTVLGVHEVAAMRRVPELVFLNCCYLANPEPGQMMRRQAPVNADPARFAAGIAQGLIQIGVRCVVAAGWAVGDEAARCFATTFYGRLLDGAPFIEAVHAARRKTWSDFDGDNTWAAYQCYGDPDWRWNAHASRDPAPPEQAGISPMEWVSSPTGLKLRLEALVSNRAFRRIDEDRCRRELEQLEASCPEEWARMGEIAQAFGVAFDQVGLRDKAIAFLRIAVTASDGSASISCTGTLANLLVRTAQVKMGTPEGRVEARRLIEDALVLLRARPDEEDEPGLARSADQQRLIGSALKRLAVIESFDPDSARELPALRMSMTRYRLARQASIRPPCAAVGAGVAEDWYSLINIIAIGLRIAVLDDPGRDSAGSGALQERDDEDPWMLARTALSQINAAEPDFWSMVGLCELRLYEAVQSDRIDSEIPALCEEFAEVGRRIENPLQWESVYWNAAFVLSACSRSMQRRSQEIPESVRQLLALLMRLARLEEPVFDLDARPVPVRGQQREEQRGSRSGSFGPTEVTHFGAVADSGEIRTRPDRAPERSPPGGEPRSDSDSAATAP